ncbi:MAG: N-acyl-D-glucosamine 2-epimerase [Limnochordales bacterium]|nr:N-acyl-D-glucosamine 2-epimerase [Limnochordales bacterium]
MIQTMTTVVACSVALLLIFLGGSPIEASESKPVGSSDSARIRELLFCEPGPTVDPGFAYYQGRSPESIAEEIALRGYRTVHLVITSEKNVNAALIDAFHDEGIAVWGMVWAGGTYSTVGFPPEWEEWRQQLIKPAAPSGFIYLSPYHPDFREWKKQSLAELVRTYPLDGIELVEAFFPNWEGLRSGVYGDIGPYAEKAFRERFGEEPPNFTDVRHPRFYTKVPDLYKKWVQFRVDTVTEWLDYLINSEGGIRDARPGIPVATWTLATDWAGALEKSRVDLGEDTAAIVSRVKPDIHFLQTNWPDWIKPDLPPDYMRKYTPFIEEIRRVAPGIPIGLQGDIGSLESMRRDWDWIGQFARAAKETGFSTYTIYEYHIGLYMYTEAPRVVKVRRGGPGWVILSFNKRVDAWSARDTNNFALPAGLTVDQVLVDGNRVMLHLQGPAELINGEVKLMVSGIADTPELRLLKNYPALTMQPQTITIPAVGS